MFKLPMELNIMGNNNNCKIGEKNHLRQAHHLNHLVHRLDHPLRNFKLFRILDEIIVKIKLKHQCNFNIIQEFCPLIYKLHGSFAQTSNLAIIITII
jgi:hypothetical protein